MANIKAEASAILAVEKEGMRAIKAKDVDSVLATYLRDASIMAPNAPEVKGPKQLRAFWTQILGTLQAFGETDLNVEVSASGDLAYLTGKYRMTLKGPNGRRVRDQGKFVDVWKRRPRAGWKHALSIFNSDLPAPGTK